MKKIVSIFLSVVITFGCIGYFDFYSNAESEKDFYSYISDNIRKFNTRIDIADYMKKNNWTFEEVKSEVRKLYLLEPEFFYVDNEIGFLYSENYERVCLEFSYLYSESEVKKMKKAMNKAALKAIEDIDDDMSDVEKALIVHDYLVLNTYYDYSGDGSNAYNCLVEKSAVCQGYSLAYMYIMNDLLGIDCSVVFSDIQNHAWNYIKIGKYWYHVDLTADDPTFSTYEGEKYDNKGHVIHNNFLLSDDACYKSSELHRDWNTLDLPKAKNKKYDNYFWKDTSGAVCEIDGLWYYTVLDKTSPGLNYKESNDSSIYTKICAYSFDTKKSEVVTRIKCSWKVYRSAETGKIVNNDMWYKGTFIKLVNLNDELYFNTSKAVYRLNTNTKKSKKIYTLKKDKMSIYAIMPVNSSKIRIVYKKDLTYKNNYLNIKLKSA